MREMNNPLFSGWREMNNPLHGEKIIRLEANDRNLDTSEIKRKYGVSEGIAKELARKGWVKVSR